MRKVLASLAVIGLIGSARATSLSPVSPAPPMAPNASVPSAVNPSASYDWNGTAWQPRTPGSGGSSASPSYSQPLNGGSPISPSNPQSVAVSEPSAAPFAMTAGGPIASTNVSVYGYHEATMYLQVTGTGGTITPQYSFDGLNWINADHCQRHDWSSFPSWAGAGAYQCPVWTPYFRWNLSGTITGTYSGYTFFSNVQTLTPTSPLTVSAAQSCTGSYHIAGGSAASTNAVEIAITNHTVCGLLITTTSATAAYLRFYDQSTTPTCSSASALVATIAIPGNSPPIQFQPFGGIQFTQGLAMCLTGGNSDTDTTNAPTGVYPVIIYQ